MMGLKESIINVSKVSIIDFKISNASFFCKYNLKIVAGDVCLFDKDCESQNHTRCSEDNECVCQKNYIKIGLLCRPLIGSFCMKTEDCFPENSVCVNHKCNCKKDFVLLSYDRCVPSKE